MKSMKILFFCLIVLMMTHMAAYSTDEYTKLYLKGNAIQDDSGNHEVSEYNVIINPDGKFGNCLMFDTYYNYATIYCANSEDWDFGTGPFTIETYIYGDTSRFSGLFSNSKTRVNDFDLYIDDSKVYFICKNDSRLTMYTQLPEEDAWIHIALVRDSDDFIHLFVNGELKRTVEGYRQKFDDTRMYIKGWYGLKIDEYKISKGIARWTRDFTPPTPKLEVSFSASSTSVDFGDPVTLFWSAPKGTICSISPEVGDVDTTGSTVVRLNAPTTFILTAEDEVDGIIETRELPIDVDVALRAQGTLIVDGKLGVGVENPGSALEVKGTVKAKEVIVTSTDWADFVFQQGYHLLPLSRVEQHIQQFHHLPGIPSGNALKTRGIPISDMMTLQMQKIEELTLYVIELSKQNRLLQEQINDLSK